jgi:hypothetical protein
VSLIIFGGLPLLFLGAADDFTDVPSILCMPRAESAVIFWVKVSEYQISKSFTS